MGQLALPLMVAGTVLGGVSSIQGASAQRAAGKAQQQEALFEAKQANIAAGQERAVAQRDAAEARRQKVLAQSRLQALGAASGTSGGDLVTLDQQLEQEGEMNALNALYSGEQRARNLETTANIKTFEGNEARRAGNMGATNTLLGGLAATGTRAGSLIEKYG